jgi:hypothetical protein
MIDIGDISNQTIRAYMNTYFLNSFSDTFFEVSTINLTVVERDYSL